MRLAPIRLGLLLAALVASPHAAAAPRFWTLTGVQFQGTSASGYFFYDDATQTVTSWNVHVPLPAFMPAFTYVPGNSSISVSQIAGAVAPTLVFSAVTGVPGVNLEMRYLQITPLAALDGSIATVALDTASSREYFPSLIPPRGRSITAGSLMLAAVPTMVVVQVDEFYHSGLRHYFITADEAEKHALDYDVHSGWVRTGESFKAYAQGSRPDGSVDPVCRYYSPPFYEDDFGIHPFGVDSHFFSADAGECADVFRRYSNWLWGMENDNAFQINLPDKATGTCPPGTIPVYRLWNQRTDSNHRYTTSTAVKADMLAAGFLAEGYGPDGVAMCAVE